MQADPSEADASMPGVPASPEPGPLTEEWPTFLDLLDSEPDAVFVPLHEFVHRLLRAFPPRVFGALPPEDREEMPGRILLRLLDEDFRRLRTYRRRGVPFAWWLLCVTRNMACEMMERRKRDGIIFTSPPERTEDGSRSSEARVPSTRPGPDMETFIRRDLEQVVDIIAAMDRKCRLLLLGSASGLAPKELTHLLGWPMSWNKRASDTLRHCRTNLRALLRKKGLEPGGLF